MKRDGLPTSLFSFSVLVLAEESQLFGKVCISSWRFAVLWAFSDKFMGILSDSVAFILMHFVLAGFHSCM